MSPYPQQHTETQNGDTPDIRGLGTEADLLLFSQHSEGIVWLTAEAGSGDRGWFFPVGTTRQGVVQKHRNPSVGVLRAS